VPPQPDIILKVKGLGRNDQALLFCKTGKLFVFFPCSQRLAMETIFSPAVPAKVLAEAKKRFADSLWSTLSDRITAKDVAREAGLLN
jgi:hypothetical protein